MVSQRFLKYNFKKIKENNCLTKELELFQQKSLEFKPNFVPLHSNSRKLIK